MKKLVAAIVLPCLDEAVTLASACRSLGFGTDENSEAGTYLFIIDNGSSDGTWEVAEEIQSSSPPGSVFLTREEERGYVPPRHTGTRVVHTITAAQGYDPRDVLVVQADADTIYDPGYIKAMCNAADAAGTNVLLEGLAEFPAEFCTAFPSYVRLCSQIDKRVAALLNSRDLGNLICTDSVSAYRLSDYHSWGGHIREYTKEGEEIYAETTRLYMRSLPHGSRRIDVLDAVAYPSARKAGIRPLAELASAGFPREPSWWLQWPPEADQLDLLLGSSRESEVQDAMAVRARHLVALFGILPLHVARALDIDPEVHNAALADIVDTLVRRDAASLRRTPGVFLTDVLSLVDHDEARLDAIWQNPPS